MRLEAFFISPFATVTSTVTKVRGPRIHYRTVDSTNAVARRLAGAQAPHGTVVYRSITSAFPPWVTHRRMSRRAPSAWARLMKVRRRS